MAEAVMGATIDLLLENLLALAKEEVGLFWNFNNELEKLKESVVAIRELLEDAEKKQLDDNLVKSWLVKLEAVAFDADYVFDELNYHVLRKKVQRDNKMKKKVRCFLPYPNSFTFRHKMAKKIKDIKNEINSIYQEASQMGLQTRIALAGGARTEAPAYLETDAVSRDPVFFGRETEVTKMVEMLTSSLNEEVISVFPIYGMGGLGKTTLAREVYSNGEIITHFGERMWVHVPENFDPVNVLKRALESLMEENVDGSREGVLRKLGKRLENKRYLLVLDNVWNVDMEIWGNFITSLKGISKVKGNVIMITTRKSNVASMVKTRNVNELEVLSEDDCWFIIKAKAFAGEGVPLEFETVGKNIAQRCGGLPLAAQVVGSLLRDKSKDEWVSIQKNQLLNIGGDGNTVSQILKLSFDNLSSPSLKKCFAFCSIIPKGWWMEKDEVIHLWMAEGLLQVDEENNMEDAGNGVFNMLVHSSLLQVIRRDSYGNAKRCNLHDLVHDFAFSVLNPKIPNNTSQLRYISIPSKDESSHSPKEYARCLRALFFSGNFSHIIISNLKRLHVLILNDEEIEELPIEIGKLISLRFLDISHSGIECLPDSIGNLYHLQTLRATREYGGEGYLKKLPYTFKYLISLRHLYIPNIRFPPGIGELASLQTLPYFQVGDEEGCGIMELGKLKNLRGEIEIHNLEKVGHKEDAKKADIFHKPNLCKLKLVWNNVSAEGERTYNDENVLEGLQPHPNLKMLEINGFKSKSFPLWTWRMAVREDLEDRWITFDNLLEIKLSDCKECEEIPMFGHLPHLKALYLHQLSNVTSLGSSFYGIKENEIYKEMVIVFPTLEKLELIEMENLTIWEEAHIPAVVFPRLEYLKIINCRKLTNSPSNFPCLKELEIENMESALALANICGSKLTSLTKLRIDGVEEFVCLPNDLFNNNRDLLNLEIRNCNDLTHLVPCLGGGGGSLRKLEIRYCRSFEELPEDLHTLNALENLKISKCPNLKSIPYQLSSQSGFTSLHTLEFSYCSSLTNFPVEVIKSCVSSLRWLSLSGLQNLTNLPQVMSILPKMPRLTELYILFVPKLSDVVAEIESLRRLEMLGIGGSSDCGDYVSFDASLDFPALQSLRYLILVGMDQWDALPNQLQHLTTLEGLHLWDFGIEALPEWIGNLSSLEALTLYNCQKLRCLPSKKAMHGLTKLVDLDIDQCPLLKQNLEEKASHDSEWSKISHIPTIEVDGNLISSSAR